LLLLEEFCGSGSRAGLEGGHAKDHVGLRNMIISLD
jgi:hypothetical protein